MLKQKTQGFSLKDKSACIIGCGGLGCNVAVHLSGSGIGKLFLCDFDTVSQSNLNRQFFYTPQDIGLKKAEKAKEFILNYAPHTEVETVNLKITKESDLFFAKDADIFILAVDNAPTRQVVSCYCRNKKIPLVCGGIDGFYGTAYLYLPDVSPCPDCAGMNESTAVGHSVSSTAGIIGAMQASIATKYLLEKKADLSGKLHVFDGDRWDTLPIRTSAECEKCKSNSSEVII